MGEEFCGWMVVCYILVFRGEKGLSQLKQGVIREDLVDYSGKCYLIFYLCREFVEEGILEVYQGEDKVFVKEVVEKFVYAIIGLAVMN